MPAYSFRFADGEVNVFVDAYEQDMESDGDDIEEVAGFSDREREDSPPAYSARDAYTLVRAAAKRNRGVSDTMPRSIRCLVPLPLVVPYHGYQNGHQIIGTSLIPLAEKPR